MARIRSIHPGLFTDEAWVSCSQSARLLVIGLWTECDDQGVFEWKPLQLKMRLFAADAVDVGALLAECVEFGLVTRYEVAGKLYGAMRNFCRYQRPRKPKIWHPLDDSLRDWVAVGAASEGEEGDEVPPKSKPAPAKTAPVPQKSVLAPQMEDGGGVEEKKELEAPLPAATAVATDRLPTEPKPPKASLAKPWLTDPDFSAAWNLCTADMRRRSLSRAETYPNWRRQALIAGGASILLSALEAYLRGDPDVKRTGGPGFHLWLKDGTWDHWTGEQAASAPGFNLAEFEAKRAQRRAAIEAEEHAA